MSVTPPRVEMLPFGLVRSCSVPLRLLAGLELPDLAADIDRLEERSARLEHDREGLCDWLYQQIGTRRDAGHDVRPWISLRRDVYNDRNRMERANGAVLAGLAATEKARWDAFVRERAALRRDSAQLAERLTVALDTVVPAALCEAFRIEAWGKALALSSLSLAREARLYSERSDHPRRRRNTIAELGGLRYLTRACTKTSPFGAFTQVTSVRLDGDTTGTHESAELAAPTSFVRVNPHLLGWVERKLRTHSPFANGVGLRVNPSLRVTGGRAQWATFGPRQSALRSAVAAPWFDSWGAPERAGVVQQAEELLLELAPYVERDQAEQVIAHLLESGLLEVDLGVSPEEQAWEAALARRLVEGFPAPSATQAAHRLQALAERKSRVAAADGPTREELMGQASGLLDEVDHLLQRQARTNQESGAPAIKLEQVFVEDCVRAGPAERGSLPPRVRQALEGLAAAWPDVPPTPAERWLRNACTSNGAARPFMSVYNDFCRDHARGELDQLLVPQPSRGLGGLEARLRGSLHGGVAEIQVAGEDFDGLGQRRAGARSTTFMLMPSTSDTGGVQPWVLDRVHAGWGGFFARYLHALDASVTSELREHIGRGEGDAVFAEISDGSLSPTNHGPPLCGHELLLPRGRARLPAGSRIRVGDLWLGFQDDQLHLHVPGDGRRVVPLDTGLALAGRSHLFRCLRTLGAPDPWPLEWLAGAIAACAAREANDWSVLSLPRVVFEDCLVLQRRRWVMRPRSLRDLDASSTARAFTSARAFRARHGLPETVFVRGGHFEEARSRSSVRHDDYKPQFISFRNPLSCRQLATLADNVTSMLEVVECLPGLELSSDAPSPRELVIQCSTHR